MVRAYFKKLFRCFSHSEMAILGNIYDEQYGGRKQQDWVLISQRAFATYAGITINGVAKALDKLVAVQAVEKRKAGRENEYRVVMENWESIVPREARKLERTLQLVPEPTDDGEAEVEDDQQAALKVMPSKEALIILPGEKSPRPLSEVCPGAASGRCELAKKLEEAKSGRNVPENVKKVEKIPTLEYGYSEAKATPLPKAQDAGLYRQFEALLKTNLASKGVAVPDTIAKLQYSRLEAAAVPLSIFEVNFRRSLKKFEKPGFLSFIVDDAILAHQQASEFARQREVSPTPWTSGQLRKQLLELESQIASNKAFRPVAVMLGAIAAQADELMDDFPALEESFTKASCKLIEIAEEVMTHKQRDELESMVERASFQYRAKLTQSEYSLVRQKFRKRFTAKVLDLPSLDWTELV